MDSAETTIEEGRKTLVLRDAIGREFTVGRGGRTVYAGPKGSAPARMLEHVRRLNAPLADLDVDSVVIRSVFAVNRTANRKQKRAHGRAVRAELILRTRWDHELRRAVRPVWRAPEPAPEVAPEAA